MKRPRIRVQIETELGSEVHFIDQDRFCIGRIPTVEISIPTQTVSRKHLLVYLVGKQIWLKDLDSSFGTKVGNSKLAPHEPRLYSPGEAISVGSEEVVLKLELEVLEPEARVEAPITKYTNVTEPKIFEKPTPQNPQVESASEEEGESGQEDDEAALVSPVTASEILPNPAILPKAETSDIQKIDNDAGNTKTSLTASAIREDDALGGYGLDEVASTASVVSAPVTAAQSAPASRQEEDEDNGMMASSYHEAAFLVTEANRKAKEIEAQASSYKARLDKDIEVLSKERVDLENENRRRRSEVEDLRAEKVRIEGENHGILTRHHSALEKTRTEYEQLRAKKQTITRENDALIKKKQDEVDRLDGNISDLRTSESQLQLSNDELEAEQAKLRASVDEIRETAKSMSEKFQSEQERITSALEKETRKLESAESNRKSALEQLESHKVGIKEAKARAKAIIKSANTNSSTIEKRAIEKEKQTIREAQERAKAIGKRAKEEAQQAISEAQLQSRNSIRQGKEQAERLASEARARMNVEFENIRESAQQNADNIVSGAKVQASELVLKAKDDGDKLREAAREEAGRIRGEAQNQANQVLGAIDEKAKVLKDRVVNLQHDAMKIIEESKLLERENHDLLEKKRNLIGETRKLLGERETISQDVQRRRMEEEQKFAGLSNQVRQLDSVVAEREAKADTLKKQTEELNEFLQTGRAELSEAKQNADSMTSEANREVIQAKELRLRMLGEIKTAQDKREALKNEIEELESQKHTAMESSLKLRVENDQRLKEAEQAAQQTAEQILSSARSEAEESREKLLSDAKGVKTAAQKMAEEVRKTAEAEAETLKSDAKKQATALLEQARNQVSSAEEEAKGLMLAKDSELKERFENQMKNQQEALAKMKLRVIEEMKAAREKEAQDADARRERELEEITNNVGVVLTLKMRKLLGKKADAEKVEDTIVDIQEVVRKAYLKEDYDEKLSMVMEKAADREPRSKSFLVKAAAGVSLMATLALVFYGLNREGTFKRSVSSVDLYVKKFEEAKKNKPKFAPEMSANFKDSYVENVLYTSNYVAVERDSEVKRLWTLKLNRFFVDELKLSEESIVKFITLENSLVAQLAATRETINPAFEEKTITRMRDMERTFDKQLLELFKSGPRVDRFRSFKKAFFGEKLDEKAREIASESVEALPEAAPSPEQFENRGGAISDPFELDVPGEEIKPE